MQFVPICAPLYLVYDLNFIQLGSSIHIVVSMEMHKRKTKKADREKFKCR